MIKSFADKRTVALFLGKPIKGVPSDIAQRAHRKLVMIDKSAVVEDMRNPPGNRLEHLDGDRAGQYSIRVNKQWRICLKWIDGDAYDVEFCDYHD